MSVNILGGHSKGFGVQISSSADFRPTSVLLRRKFFDRFQDLHNFHFIDLCAGSGAMGFEALSRGAEQVTWVEKNKLHLEAIKKNYQLMKERFYAAPSLDHLGEVSFVHADICKFLNSANFLIQSSNVMSTILFFDPPYEEEKLYVFWWDWCLKLKDVHQMYFAVEYQKATQTRQHNIKAKNTENIFKLLNTATEINRQAIFHHGDREILVFTMASDRSDYST